MKYAIYAFIVSAVVTIALGPVIIPMLRRMKFGQNERSDGPQSHLSKAGTPTMGGMMFIAGILVGTLAFSLNATELALPALLATAAFALVGFLDDFLKVKQKNTIGLRPYQKIIAQFAIAFILALYAYQQAEFRQRDAYNHRAVAYQAYQVQDYQTALQAWKV